MGEREAKQINEALNYKTEDILFNWAGKKNI